MNPSQNWQRARDQFKFNSANQVIIKSTSQIGVVVCTGTNDEGRVYMIKLINAGDNDPFKTVKETDLEFYP